MKATIELVTDSFLTLKINRFITPDTVGDTKKVTFRIVITQYTRLHGFVLRSNTRSSNLV